MQGFKKLFYALVRIFWFPVDLFLFTFHCWLYTFGMIHYRVRNGHPDQPCLFCRGLDVGLVPRRITKRIHYRNIWLAKLLHPKLEVIPRDDRMKPTLACRNEGGYIKPGRWVPYTAVILGTLWISAFAIGLWHSPLVPEYVKTELDQKD